jgi:hypothetical protein
MRPYFIETRLKLRNPIYSETAAYGHMGRQPQVVEKTFVSPDGKDGDKKGRAVYLGETGLCSQGEEGFRY